MIAGGATSVGSTLDAPLITAVSDAGAAGHKPFPLKIRIFAAIAVNV